MRFHHLSDPVADLRGAVAAAAGELRGDGPAPRRRSSGRRSPDFGDYSTNAAMLLAPALGEPPRAIAERLGDVLGERLGEAVDKVEVAGPGFLNLFMSDTWYLGALAGLLAAGDSYGAGRPGRRAGATSSSCSANPTGPAQRRLRPPRRLRRLALPDPRARRRTRSSASTT